MDLSRSRSRRVKISYTIDWPQQKDGGHLLAPSAAQELDDGRIVSVGRDTTIRVWKGQSNVKTYYTHTDSVNDLDVQPRSQQGSSQLIATAGNDYRVCVVDGSRSAPVGMHTEHGDAVKRVRFTIDNHILSAGLDCKLVLWDLSRGQAVAKLPGADSGFYSLALQPSSTRAIVGCMKGSLYHVDPRESNAKCRYYQQHAHSGTVRDIAFIDDSTFATGGSDGVVRLWDLRNPRQSYKLHCHLHHEPVFSLATKGHYVLSGSRDGQILLTDPQQMQTATVIQMNYPIFNISWNERSNNVTVCTSKPDVELYELTTCFDDDTVDGTPFQTPMNSSHAAGHGMDNTSAISMASPSKVELILDEESEQLIPIEGRKYGRAGYRQLKHPNRKAEKLWCTSVSHPRISDPEFSVGDEKGARALRPKLVLKGSTEGFVSARLLSDKRHALAMTAKGTIELWNIIKMVRIDGPHTSARSMREAVKICGSYAYGASWCRIDCAWGALRLTLSHDEAFNAQANLWEYKFLSSIAAIKDNLSIYQFSVKERRDMEKTIINLGEEMLRFWCKTGAEVYVVQTKQGSVGSSGGSENFAGAPSSIRTHFTDNNDGKLPTWALTCLSSGVPSARSSNLASSVNVRLEPFDATAKLQVIEFAFPKNRPVADLCVEVMTKNKLSAVGVAELEDYRIKSPASSLASPDEMIEFIAVGRDILSDCNDDEDSDACENGNSGSDCGSDFALTRTSVSSDKADRVIDPLMMVVTAFYTYKERGSGTLRLRYRVRKGAKVKVDDL